MGLLAFVSNVALAAGDPRPELSGPVREVSRGGFRVHWTEAGADALPGGDLDGDGQPDAVARVLGALESADRLYQAEGWRTALADDGEGGSDAIDVYLHEVDINGYAHPIDVGQGLAHACWMEVDKALANGDTLILESVTAHEFHHCVEYAYTPFADSWMYESTATWAQYRAVVDDVLEVGASVLWGARLREPERRIDDVGGRFEYAGFVWVKFWAESGGRDPSRVPAVWEALAEADSDWEDAHEVEAQRVWGRSLDASFLEHAVWNGFACGRDDGAHYEPLVHRCLVDSEVPVEGVASDEVIFEHVDDPYTARYASVQSAGDDRPIGVTCDDPGPDARAGLALVAVDASGVAGESVTAWASEGEGLSVRLDRTLDAGGSVLLVHASTGRDPALQTCTLSRLDAVEVDPAGGCDTGGAGRFAGAFGLVLAIRRRAV